MDHIIGLQIISSALRNVWVVEMPSILYVTSLIIM